MQVQICNPIDRKLKDIRKEDCGQIEVESCSDVILYNSCQGAHSSAPVNVRVLLASTVTKLVSNLFLYYVWVLVKILFVRLLSSIFSCTDLLFINVAGSQLMKCQLQMSSYLVKYNHGNRVETKMLFQIFAKSEN